MKKIGMIVDVEINSVLNKFGTKLTKEEAASLCLDIVEEIIKEI